MEAQQSQLLAFAGTHQASRAGSDRESNSGGGFLGPERQGRHARAQSRAQTRANTRVSHGRQRHAANEHATREALAGALDALLSDGELEVLPWRSLRLSRPLDLAKLGAADPVLSKQILDEKHSHSRGGLAERLWVARDQLTSQSFVMHRLFLTPSSEVQLSIAIELEQLRHMRHASLLPMLALVADPFGDLALLSECPAATLHAVLRHAAAASAAEGGIRVSGVSAAAAAAMRGCTLDWQTLLLAAATDVACGLAHLHKELKTAHGQLTPVNVVLMRDWQCKLIEYATHLTADTKHVGRGSQPHREP